MRKNNLKVLFVASECSPLAKVGGLADVVGSLPKALKKLGVDIRIVIPKYKVIDLQKHPFKLIAKKIKVGRNFVNIYQGFLPASSAGGPESKIILYLLENEKYFGENGVYFGSGAFVDSFKEIKRFLIFSKAILEIFENLKWHPQIIHCHDWHAAVVSFLAKVEKKRQKIILTIHNLANQGKWSPESILNFLGLRGNEIESFKIKDKDGDFNILQQGILNADLINTVSPTYAREILTQDYGEELEQTLLKRKKDLFGILNGIDPDRFNPNTDSNLKVNYSFPVVNKKRENKKDLQKILKLPQNQNIPLLSFVGRLTSQKGIDLILQVIPELVRLNAQLIVLGKGNKQYEDKLLDLEERYQGNISVQIKFDPV